MTQIVKLHVNGVDYELALDTRTTLVDALRDHLASRALRKAAMRANAAHAPFCSTATRSHHAHTLPLRPRATTS